MRISSLKEKCQLLKFTLVLHNDGVEVSCFEHTGKEKDFVVSLGLFGCPQSFEDAPNVHRGDSNSDPLKFKGNQGYKITTELRGCSL